MKRFSTLSLVLVLTLILSACGAREVPAAPTADPVDIQSTIAMAAFTMVAQTQAALPTATPVPPTATVTNTPPPTNTIPPLPDSGATLTPNSSSGGADPCINRALPASVQGEVRMRITNSTDVQLSLTVYLNQAGPQAECGYRSYTLAPSESLALNNMVEGCYSLWAWNPIPEDYFIVTNGTSCVDDSEAWVFDISPRSITLRT